jgi:hypothetical protein
MANAMFQPWKQNMLTQTTVRNLTANYLAYLSSSPSIAATAITTGVVGLSATEQPTLGSSGTGGSIKYAVDLPDIADTPMANSRTVNAIAVMWRNSVNAGADNPGTAGSNYPAILIDTASGLPYTTNSSTTTIVWDNGNDKVWSIV